jgi:hypothetical protein
MAAQCEHRRPDGTRCRAPAVRGSDRCFAHDPATAERTAAGRRQGGETRNRPAATLPPDTPPLRLETVADVTSALGEAYNLVRTGRLAVNVGNCLAVIGQGLLKAMERADLEARIAALEANQARTRR